MNIKLLYGTTRRKDATMDKNVTIVNRKLKDSTNILYHNINLENTPHNLSFKYLDIYIAAFIKPFHTLTKNTFNISIYGLCEFIKEDDYVLQYLLEQMANNGFTISLKKPLETVDKLDIEYTETSSKESGKYEFQIVNLQSIIELSSKTCISCAVILIMKATSKLICKYSILYKAFVLDLDETLWPGILAEEGINKMATDMHSDKAKPFITFMKYINVISEELGIFVVICSRNDKSDVIKAIEKLDKKIFPLKDQIDYIVANYNDKSQNIKDIASHLSILPSAIVFIDDNKIIRDEVRKKLPEVFVPEWKCHDELITELNAGCIFERFELSRNSQQRRKQFQILEIERSRNIMPHLFIKIIDDYNHFQSDKLYAKSNQFKLVQNVVNNKELESKYFEIYRENGENLGVCSAFTYKIENSTIYIKNWAISCRYFGIGLEEYILLYILQMAKWKNIYFYYSQSDRNIKVQDMLKKYSTFFLTHKSKNTLEFKPNQNTKTVLESNTNLKTMKNE